MKTNKTLKGSFILALILMMAVFAAACGGNNGNSEPSASSDNTSNNGGEAVEKVELKVATWAGAGELSEFEELVSGLNAKSDQYEIEIQSIPADYYQKLQTMIAGKQAPDFMWLSQEHIPQYAKLGVLQPLDELLKETDGFNRDDYFDGAYNVSVYQEQAYALPWISQPYMLYFNQDMFEEAGVEVPANDWTWEQFIAAGEKLTKDGQWGALLNNMPLPMFMWSYGGDTFDENGDIVLGEEGAIKGLEMYQRIASSGIAPERATADSMGGADMFKTGKVGMFMGGAGDDLEKTVSFNVGMAVPPKGTEQVTFSWIGVTAMSKSTENPEVAAQALVDMTQAMHEWKVPAPTKTALDLIAEARPDKAYAVDTIRAASEVARGFNNQPQQAEIDTMIWEKLTQPLEQGEDVQKAVDETVEKFEKIIK
ncbi:ABC transporter substrate-binding protein [Marinicrinis sediminis]|uniref:ABC transporter substrate-binding protein n=1 Tax=Marinicrinis sediminis TaxID=1652465 RepID=A0ABW5RD21_9BACL